MKYINVMAGAFGLMALAACSNNDEVTVEQPQVARTLTVTLGNGADTRLTLSEFDAKEGIKGSWESTDEIGVAALEASPKVFTYKSTGSGPSVVFTLDGEDGPTEGKTYGIAYPPSYITEGYDFRKQTGLQEGLKDYAHAMTIVDSFSALDNKVTLTPICSFLYIPKGTEFPGLSVGSSGVNIEITGNGIVANAGPDVNESDNRIFIDVDGSLFNGATTTDDLYIALPVQKEKDTYQAITDLSLTITLIPTPTATTKASFTTYKYYIVKNASADTHDLVEITEPGKVYVLASKNLYRPEK
ncbi:MAG: hypothetical protein IJV42_10485 [Bacteroidaceae bacterium]|nr:hypothetical protein [Bacteroidaceae bacterium]